MIQLSLQLVLTIHSLPLLQITFAIAWECINLFPYKPGNCISRHLGDDLKGTVALITLKIRFFLGGGATHAFRCSPQLVWVNGSKMTKGWGPTFQPPFSPGWVS